jgi:hypothetical protein
MNCNACNALRNRWERGVALLLFAWCLAARALRRAAQAEEFGHSFPFWGKPCLRDIDGSSTTICRSAGVTRSALRAA